METKTDRIYYWASQKIAAGNDTARHQYINRQVVLVEKLVSSYREFASYVIALRDERAAQFERGFFPVR